MHKKQFASAGLAAALIAGAVAIPATVVSPASAAVVGTHLYSTESSCKAGVAAAKKQGKSVTQNCTYAGPKFLWIKTAAGPWIAAWR